MRVFDRVGNAGRYSRHAFTQLVDHWAHRITSGHLTADRCYFEDQLIESQYAANFDPAIAHDQKTSTARSSNRCRWLRAFIRGVRIAERAASAKTLASGWVALSRVA